MTIHHTPWHALTVSEVWYCVQPEPDTADMPCRDEDGWCTGHGEPASGLRPEIQHDWEHPADCESLPDYADCLTADMVCNGNNGSVPTLPGAYRVRAWMRLPDEPVAGSGLECEPVAAGGAS